jgi:hypothetical protein
MTCNQCEAIKKKERALLEGANLSYSEVDEILRRADCDHPCAHADVINENEMASKSNLRMADRRVHQQRGPVFIRTLAGCHFRFEEQRTHERRRIVSSMERDMLLGGVKAQPMEHSGVVFYREERIKTLINATLSTIKRILTGKE